MLFTFLLLLVLFVLLLVYMFVRAHKDHVDFHTILEPSFPSQSKYTLFYISDVHNRIIKKRTLDHIKNIDCVIIGGDLVDRRVSIDRLNTNIKRLKRWGAPIYFIPGNNDAELKEDNILSVLERHQIKVLSNTEEDLQISPATFIRMKGVDPYDMKPRGESSSFTDPYQYKILVIHDPYIYKKMSTENQQHYNLVLSGHTHGGQIRFLGIGPYEQGGWFKGKNTLLVSEGYGTSLVPLRLGTKAECHVIELVKEKAL